jgi:hypothetical protein
MPQILTRVTAGLELPCGIGEVSKCSPIRKASAPQVKKRFDSRLAVNAALDDEYSIVGNELGQSTESERQTLKFLNLDY